MENVICIPGSIAEEMTAEEFVRVLKASVRKGAVEGMIEALQKSPGRQPDPAVLELSRWFNELDPDDRAKVARVADKAAEHATYIFLSMLDGLLAFEPAGPKGALELIYSDSKSRLKLNDEEGEPLTVLFKDAD